MLYHNGSRDSCPGEHLARLEIPFSPQASLLTPKHPDRYHSMLRSHTSPSRRPLGEGLEFCPWQDWD